MEIQKQIGLGILLKDVYIIPEFHVSAFFPNIIIVQERHLKTQCASNALMENSQMATQLLVCLTQGKGTFHLIYQCSLYNCIYIIVMSSANLYSQRNVGIA
jgi:hypothetical protein